MKPPDVDLQARLGTQGDLIPLGVHPALAEGRVEIHERPAQPGTGALAVRIGPEQRRQRLAAVRLARDGQIGQQRQRLAPLDRDRHAIALDARGTEEVKLRVGIAPPGWQYYTPKSP